MLWTAKQHNDLTLKDSASILAGIKRHFICSECEPPHVSNCDTCFGWGLKSNGAIIAAEDLNTITEWVICSECGGNSKNEHLKVMKHDLVSSVHPR